MAERPRKGKQVRKGSRKPAMNRDEVSAEANKQITLREFNPDYDLVVKRISTAPNGLRCGAPPGTVT